MWQVIRRGTENWVKPWTVGPIHPTRREAEKWKKENLNKASLSFGRHFIIREVK